MKKQKNKQGIKASKLAKAENKLKHQAEQMITVKNAEGEPDTQAKILIQNKISYTPKVSVIIPVYNVEEYLRECLDSVINQTLKEIEIICVDDGSIDNSLEILKEYAKKDNRISVLTQENLHAGVARNAGLAVAKGEYVHFLDSDDWIDKETYQEVLQDINSSDIGIFKGIRIDYKLMQKVDMTWLASPKLNGIYNTEALYKNLYTLFSPEIWNKLYKLNFLRKFNLYFQSIISCNDVYFSYAALGLSQTLSVKQSMFYHYRFNTGKQITSIRQNYPLNILYALNGVRKTLEKNGKIAQLEESLQNAAVNDIVYSIKKCNSMQYISQYAKFFTGKRADEYICAIKKTMTIPIVFATNDQYARYVPVTIYSILCNSDTAYTYEFYIFHTGLLTSSKKLIENIPIMEKHNYQIKFINLKKQLNNTTLYSKGRFSVEMWYRLFIPETLKEYKKAIYLDCDLIVQGDIAQLYNKDIGQNYLGACRNFVTTSKERLKKLNIPIDRYFNSGVLVFNIEEWNKKHIKQACLDAIPLYPNLDCPDQDILNIVCKGKVKYFDYKWNFSWQFLWDNNLSNEEAEIYQQAQEEICIIHYTSGLKPWKNSDLRFADIWWKYANSIGIKKTSHDYKRELQIWYQRVMGEYLNLDNPRTFNEKIQWLKLYNSTPIKTRLADKYLVRDWVKEKIGEQYLIPLLGVYDKFEDIDFDKLPNQFVIKCNHGSGWNIIVKDKSKLNLSEVKEKLDKWMSTNFAFKVGCELHYKNMQPKIIIEKYMEDDSGDLRDYKFLCFDGIVKYIWVDGERYSEHKRNLYDLKWNLLKKKIGEGRIYQNIKNCPKPYNLDKMIEFATLLSKDFSFVRVDFFEANKKLYFGEMTFTSASGTHITEPKSFIFELGDLIKLPKLAYNIETGEYYKLPKRSKIKPYILLPYNLCQKVYWRCEERKINCKYIRKQLSNTRIDIKNFGNKNNAVEITASAKVSQPDWFSNAQGIGQVVSANNKIQNITIKVIQDGKLRLDFKGTYKNIEGKNYPVWIDYKSIKIDGKEILSAPIATWHDKPFRYEMPVKNGQIVKVEVVQQYHQYSKDELKDVILKLNPNSDYIKENIEKLTHEIYKKITKYKVSQISQLPIIEADYFIPLGIACRPAFWLKKYGLRQASYPFDWMMSYSLSTVINTITKGCDDWFSNYTEDRSKINAKVRYVTDNTNHIISMHGFPSSCSVDEFLPEFQKTMQRRIERLQGILSQSQRICILCNRDEGIDSLSYFGKKMNEIYPHLNITIINVVNTNTRKDIEEYDISKKLKIYLVRADDTNEKGADKAINPNFWIGNEKLYEEICSKFKIVKSSPQTTLFARAKQNVQEQIKLWQDKLSFAHKIAPVMDLMQKNQAQTLQILQEIQTKNVNLENKNNELKKEIEVLKGAFNTQLSDFKKQQEERSKQLMAIGDRLSVELQRATNELQNAEQSQASEIKATLSEFIAQLAVTENKLSAELQRATNELQNAEKSQASEIRATLREFIAQLAVTENKLSAELQRTTEELQNAEQSQASEIKATLSEFIAQLAVTENKLSAELQRATEKLQNSGISEISEIKTYCADFAQYLDNAQAKMLSELNNQRETALQNKNNIIAGINQTEQSLQMQASKSHELVQEQMAILDRVRERLEDLSTLKEIDFAQKSELDVLSQDIEKQKSELLEKVQNLQNKAQLQYQELNFADLLHDSTQNSPWLKDKNFALYGWAANYSFIYTLFRILDNVQPAHILEMGLGQTSMVTTQYIANKKPAADLDIIENDESWIKVYEPKLAKSQNIKLHQCDIEFFDYEGEQSRKYKELNKITGDKKYNLIIVDGPFGGAQKFPRSNIVELVEKNLAQDFIIIFDDAERSGEQNTIAQTKAKLTSLGIEFGTQQRNALKSQVLIFSKSCEFAKYL